METEQLNSDEIVPISFELAHNQYLFQILSFLDGKLPSSSSIHSLIKAGLITSSSEYKIYFQRNPNKSKAHQDDDDFKVVLGIRSMIPESDQPTVKFWNVVGWSSEEDYLLKIIDKLEEINWEQDKVLFSTSKFEPTPTVREFLIRKSGQTEAVLSDDDRHQLYLPINKNLNLTLSDAVNQFYLPIQQALSLSLSMPEDVYVTSLESCHAQIIYDHWKYSKVISVEMIGQEIDAFPSAGVFLKATDELVAWMMCYPPHGMGRLHTLEMYRRKGYASLVVRYLSKRTAQAGFLPTVNIGNENRASYELFKSIGFQSLHPWQLYEKNLGSLM